MPEVDFYFNRELDPKLIANTWELAFGRDFDLRSWEWFFKNNPFSDKIYIAYIIENKVLASYAAFQPTQLTSPGGDQISAGNMNMWMTHPGFQKKGLIVEVLNAMFEELSIDNYSCLYSFPTRDVTWKLMHKYLNWSDIMQLQIQSIQYVSAKMQVPSEFRGAKTRTGKLSSALIPKLLKMDVTKRSIYIPRTESYLSWRFLNHPSKDYYFHSIEISDNMIGCMIFKDFETEIDVMEYFYNPEYSILKNEILLFGFRELLSNPKCTGINYWTIADGEMETFLRNNNSYTKDLITYFGCVLLDDQEDVKKKQNWHLSFMDSDLY